MLIMREKHGTNPHRQPMYRVVWAPSRTYKVGGCWPDGKIEYREIPYYGGLKAWVLEKWLTPEQYAGPEARWNAETIDQELAAHGIFMYTLGEYPRKGWYDHCYTFPSDSEPNLDAIVPLLEQSKNLTLAQIKAGIALYHERKKKAWEQKVEDGMADVMPAFGFKPTNISPSKPHGDTGGLSNPAALKKAMDNYTGDDHQPVDVDPSTLPQHGFSIRQRGN